MRVNPQAIAAMRALATEGIQRGHMSLHARNVAVAAGTAADEMEHVVSRMIKERAIRPDAAQRILAELRSATPAAAEVNKVTGICPSVAIHREPTSSQRSRR